MILVTRYPYLITSLVKLYSQQCYALEDMKRGRDISSIQKYGNLLRKNVGTVLHGCKNIAYTADTHSFRFKL